MQKNEVFPEKRVGALVSGLRVLRYLAANDAPVGVTRIARELALNASTCFNLLKTLVYEGLVSFDESTKTYAIALGLVELTKGVLEHASQIRMLRPHLEAVAATHRVTATLWQRTSQDRVVLVDLASTDATIRVHLSIGQRLPIQIAAMGRCLAAHAQLTLPQLRQQLAAVRWENAPDFADYCVQVQQARQYGYAVDHSNYVRGVTTVSSLIVDADKRVIMALNAVGFSTQFSKAEIRRLGEDLHMRSQSISRALSGGVETPPQAA